MCSMPLERWWGRHTMCKRSATGMPTVRSAAGCLLNVVGLVFLGVSHTAGGVNLLHPGAILIGLGGITFHLAQVHRSDAFTRHERKLFQNGRRNLSYAPSSSASAPSPSTWRR